VLVLVETESDVLNMTPDFQVLKEMDDIFAFIVTAKGSACDFVSRFFIPNAGINEDPVTGSAHSTLIPFWSKRLGKAEMTARQLSKRGGTLFCKNSGARVEIGGKAALYLTGDISL
jgi:predicted PhzF superfamily epimerase YddE/YHI9